MLPWMNRKKYFAKNVAGLSLGSDGNGEGMMVFGVRELSRATNNFSKKNLIGAGAVYKGTISDGSEVAIKKVEACNINPGDEAFINKVVILSRIRHRNIVGLLGCCLETEAPLLVYEYINCGDLSFRLRDDKNSKDEGMFTLSWEMRVKIAAETAGGLSYLHDYCAAEPVYHRDVKTDNILLDHMFTAKLAGFGISNSASGGSPGYIDPEYMETGRYTEKSDVYSFGVVLAELLTGKRPVYAYTSDGTLEEVLVILADLFKELETGEIMGTFLDARVKRQGKKESVEAAIEIAKRCLEREGGNRPTMRDVAAELEGIRSTESTNAYAQEMEEHEYEASVEITANPIGHHSSDDDDDAPTMRIDQECKASDACGASEASDAGQEMSSQGKASGSVKPRKQSGQSVWSLLGQRTV